MRLPVRGFTPDPVPKPVSDWRRFPNAGMLVFRRKEMLVKPGENSTFTLPAAADLSGVIESVPLRVGELDGAPYFGVQADSLEQAPENLEFRETRLVLNALDEHRRCAGCRAKELIFWRSKHRFCGKCGHPLAESDSDISLVCGACGEHYFPQLAPAVIVAVTRGKEILLAHNRNFRPGVFSIIAGFVETGETAEQAVRRELMEETGIEVGNVKYASSQSWPFPSSLMLGFTAEYRAGELRPDGTELDQAGWFTPETMPSIPAPGSIARFLIEEYLGKSRK